MALEDILEGFERFGSSERVVEASRKNMDSTEALNNFLAYSQKYEKLPQPALQALSEDISKNRAKMGKMAEKMFKYDIESLAEKVSDNYAEIVQSLPNGSLKNLAFAVSGVDEGYRTIATDLKKGDVESARKAYVGLCPDSKLWKEFIEGDGEEIEPASQAFLEQFAQIYLRIKRDKLEEEELSTETKENDKTTYEFNAEKAKNYVLKTVGDLKDDEKKNEIYLAAAGEYYQFQKKEKEDDEEKDEK